MIDLIILITMLIIAIKAFIAIRKNSEVFIEFGQSKVLSILVFLYPIGPIILMLGGARLPRIIVFGMAIACYLPSLIITIRQSKVFDCAGTDRVNGAQSGLSYAITGAIVGLVYLSFIIVLSVTFSSYDGI